MPEQDAVVDKKRPAATATDRDQLLSTLVAAADPDSPPTEDEILSLILEELQAVGRHNLELPDKRKP